MKRLLILTFLAAALAAQTTATSAPKPAAPKTPGSQPHVLAIHFTTDINQVSQDWFASRLHQAESNGDDAVVIVLDTPGGDLESMLKMIKEELAAKIPVIVYVAPNGAQAASAGVGIALAADVLAMAPVTNIGSSTPIDATGQNIGSDLRRKVINDMAATFRALAKSHGRNVAFADAAVRTAKNLTALEALHQNVIDTIAPSLPRLLDKIDGWHVKSQGRSFTLHTANAKIENTSPGVFTQFLEALLNPNLVGLLLLAGIAGIGFEVLHPGVVLPGALGAVSLIAALFGLSVLSFTWSGLGLIVLGVILLVLDLHYPTHGALTLSGLVAMSLGLITLFHTAPGSPTVSKPLVITFTFVIGGLWAFGIGKSIASRRVPVAMRADDVIGMEGEVRAGGLVFVKGELWQAQSPNPLREGETVRVDGLDGLTLTVHRV